jgi:hypothetical protein
MIKQQFYTVWRNGEEWYDFPQANEQNVTDFLMQKGIMQECLILPQGQVPHKVKVVTANPNHATTEKLMKEIEELKAKIAEQEESKTTPKTVKK